MLSSNLFVFLIPFAVIFIIMVIAAIVMFRFMTSRFKEIQQRSDEILERAASESRKNDGALEHSFSGTAVIKRTKVSHGPCGPGTTTYYVTFEKEDGDRTEFKVSGEYYGLIAEGDRGTVTHKGTDLVSFERER